MRKEEVIDAEEERGKKEKVNVTMRKKRGMAGKEERREING